MKLLDLHLLAVAPTLQTISCTAWVEAHTVRFFALGWPPGTRRTLGCYLYHSEKILTHPTPPGLTELDLSDAKLSPPEAGKC